MRRGFTLSGIVHFILLLLLWIKLPSFDFSPPPVVQVKLMTSAQAEAVASKPQPTPPLRTQQSAAPREAPKPKEVKADKPKHATQLKAEPVKPVEPAQPYPQAAVAEGTSEQDLRPEKLDKTPDKQNVLNDKSAELREVTEQDFAAALDFLKQLEKENTTAEATTTVTDAAAVVDIDAVEVDKIRKHIERNWYRPSGLQNLAELAIIVEVRLDRDGTVIGIEVSQSSGQPFFDASLVRAVKKASPIPIPQDKYDTYQKLELRFNG